MNSQTIAPCRASLSTRRSAQHTSTSSGRMSHSLSPLPYEQPTVYKLTPSRLEDAKLYGNNSESQAASYDRDHPLYPYKSHGQWLKACYGLVGLIILILFNGVAAFIEPFNVRKFVSAYISVSLISPCLVSIVPQLNIHAAYRYQHS